MRNSRKKSVSEFLETIKMVFDKGNLRTKAYLGDLIQGRVCHSKRSNADWNHDDNLYEHVLSTFIMDVTDVGRPPRDCFKIIIGHFMLMNMRPMGKLGNGAHAVAPILDVGIWVGGQSIEQGTRYKLIEPDYIRGETHSMLLGHSPSKVWLRAVWMDIDSDYVETGVTTWIAVPEIAKKAHQAQKQRAARQMQAEAKHGQ